MTKITPIALPPEHARMWQETRGALMWQCPAFTHLLVSMLNCADTKDGAMFSRDIPIAATDGYNLILNPDTFFKFTLPQRVFIVAHEILHNVYNHIGFMQMFSRAGKVKYPDGKALDYDRETMNKAMDYVINDLLINDKIGAFPTCGLHDRSKGTKDDRFDDVYRKLFKQQSGKGGGGAAPGQPGGGFDMMLPPGTTMGKDPNDPSTQRSKAEWDTAIAGALAVAKATGTLPQGLGRLFEEIVQPQVSWQDHIRAELARKIGSGGYDWRRADRRLISRDIIAPSSSGHGCDMVVVAIDTSGSIGQTELDFFFAELGGILEDVRPNQIAVMWCDAKVHKIDIVEEGDDIYTLKPAGGGGTSFVPVFEKVDELGLRPDALVYLTDGLGAFPSNAPQYPVIWGDIHHSVTFPFGAVVKIDLGNR